MEFQKYLRKCLLCYPTIYTNALEVYNHLFCVIGNGYDWVDGELISTGSRCEKYDGYITVKDAVLGFLEEELVVDWQNDISVTRDFAKLYTSPEEIAKYVARHNKSVIEDVKKIFNVDERINDFSIPKTIVGEFKFYPLSTYSAICNIPDDIKPDWLNAAKKMIDLMEEHKDILEDPENLLESTKERILDLKAKELAKEFMDTILYDNDYINREEPFNEERHYGNWVEKITAVLKPILEKVGFELFSDEFIVEFGVGTDDDIERYNKQYPDLVPLNNTLNNYFYWLEKVN